MIMKINSDFNGIIPQQVKTGTTTQKQAPVNPGTVTVTGNPGIAADTFSAMNMERSYMEALSIAQMSQSIIQKAMTISTRLRSIVSEAFTTGRINTDELKSSLTQIDSTIQEYGEKVVMPAAVNRNSAAIPHTAETAESLKQLKNTALELQNRGTVQADKLASIDKSLEEGKNRTMAAVKGFQESLNYHLGQYPAGGVRELQKSGERIMELIGTNPINAMKTQGNISHTKAVSLIS